jgi:hypothetical protein
MQIASFLARKSNSGFSQMSIPMIKRGQIVADENGTLLLVWSVSLGVVHAHPLRETFVNDGSCIRAKFTLSYQGETFRHDMWLDADARRHLPVYAVTVYPSDATDLIPALCAKLKQIERREARGIRSAYAA